MAAIDDARAELVELKRLLTASTDKRGNPSPGYGPRVADINARIAAAEETIRGLEG